MKGDARRKLYAKPTRVTLTQTTVVREIDRLWLRVQLRAAELGLTLTQVAARMNVARPRMAVGCGRRAIPMAWLERLSAALEMAPGDWDRPLPQVPNVSQETMRKKLRRKLR